MTLVEEIGNELKDAGFKNVNLYFEPDSRLYVLDVDGHPKQIGNHRIQTDSWYSLRGEINAIKEFYGKTRKRVNYTTYVESREG